MHKQLLQKLPKHIFQPSVFVLKRRHTGRKKNEQQQNASDACQLYIYNAKFCTTHYVARNGRWTAIWIALNGCIFSDREGRVSAPANRDDMHRMECSAARGACWRDAKTTRLWDDRPARWKKNVLLGALEGQRHRHYFRLLQCCWKACSIASRAYTNLLLYLFYVYLCVCVQPLGRLQAPVMEGKRHTAQIKQVMEREKR